MIGFYMPFGAKASEVALDGLDRGNPGVGGTQYLFLLTVSRLNEMFGPGTAHLYSDRVFASSRPSVPVSAATSLDEAIRVASAAGAEYLVINARELIAANLGVLKGSDLPLVAWAHNTLPAEAVRVAAACPSIARVACVSESQWKSMSDSACFDKCVPISNGLPDEFLRAGIATDYARPEAVYVGSVYPQKGLHNLLSIWRRVISEVPDARLSVIGGAQIWGPEVELGPMSIAEPHYEATLTRRLRRLPAGDSVRFLGPMSWDEIGEHLKHVRVGIANPSRYLRDETFCMVAVELQSRGVPIVTRRRGDGLETTVRDGVSGHLERGDRRIAERLVSVLLDRQHAQDLGGAAREHAASFRIDSAVEGWMGLLSTPVVVGSHARRSTFSRDSILLVHDRMLKAGHHLTSGRLLSHFGLSRTARISTQLAQTPKSN